MFLEYFTAGTEATQTGGQIGIEVETDFVTEDGQPIDVATSARLMLKPKPSCRRALS